MIVVLFVREDRAYNVKRAALRGASPLVKLHIERQRTDHIVYSFKAVNFENMYPKLKLCVTFKDVKDLVKAIEYEKL